MLQLIAELPPATVALPSSILTATASAGSPRCLPTLVAVHRHLLLMVVVQACFRRTGDPRFDGRADAFATLPASGILVLIGCEHISRLATPRARAPTRTRKHSLSCWRSSRMHFQDCGHPQLLRADATCRTRQHAPPRRCRRRGDGSAMARRDDCLDDCTSVPGLYAFSFSLSELTSPLCMVSTHSLRRCVPGVFSTVILCPL